MPTTRKRLEDIRKEGGGKVDAAKLDGLSEADIERMVEEDREDASFPRKAKPARITRPRAPAMSP